MTIDLTTLVIVLSVVVGWLALLSAVLLRRRRSAADPVYQRLPDGRVRFEWSVNTAYQAARRAAPARPDALPRDSDR